MHNMDINDFTLLQKFIVAFHTGWFQQVWCFTMNPQHKWYVRNDEKVNIRSNVVYSA